MLSSTFILLKGVGEHTERRLWDNGVPDWRSFLAHPAPLGIGPARKQIYDQAIASALRHLEDGDARYFARCLKSREHWRLFDTFKSRTVYLDIETTGDPPQLGDVTLVGLYGEGRMTSLVQGDSLSEDRLQRELSRYDLIVTFAGSLFDLPYLRAKFPRLILDQPHFDLCFAARRLGLEGGLKRIEAHLGLTRPEHIQGLDGWEAVRLWQAWRRGKTEALDLLLQYNEMDVRNLEPLAGFLYEGLLTRCRALSRPPVSLVPSGGAASA
jgi:uncharacterized protein YprB with RNaseH-like and TPR domain